MSFSLMATRGYLSAIFLNCLLPLLIGAAAYLFRAGTVLHPFFTFKPIAVQSTVLRKVINVLPDFCWSYSLACALFLFAWYYDLNFSKIAVLIFILVVGSELVQLALPRYFTFDLFDLAATVLAFALSWVQMQKRPNENEI